MDSIFERYAGRQRLAPARRRIVAGNPRRIESRRRWVAPTLFSKMGRLAGEGAAWAIRRVEVVEQLIIAANPRSVTFLR